ncbi:MAG TPA: hypothetical protein VIG89_05035 [Candidatus Acidoferrales bacterium]
MLARSIRNVDYDVLADEMFALRRSGQSGAAVKLFNERSDPFVIGAFVSGWLVTRLPASPLSALHYFEYE